MKCWAKRECLPQTHVIHLNSFISANDCDDNVDIDLTPLKWNNNRDSKDIISIESVREIKDSLSDYQNLPNPPLRHSLIS